MCEEWVAYYRYIILFTAFYSCYFVPTPQAISCLIVDSQAVARSRHPACALPAAAARLGDPGTVRDGMKVGMGRDSMRIGRGRGEGSEGAREREREKEGEIW